MSWITEKLVAYIFGKLMDKYGFPKVKTFGKWMRANWVFLLLPLLYVIAITGLSKTATRIVIIVFLAWLFVKVILPMIQNAQRLRYARVGKSYPSPNFDMDHYH